jgi:PAS domain S-box-containing protein
MSQRTTNATARRHSTAPPRRAYKPLIESVPAIVWRADARTLEFTFVSKQAESILGYPARAWLAERGFRLKHVHPDDKQSAAHFWKTAGDNGGSNVLDYRMTAASGAVVWLRDRVRVMVAEDGRRELAGITVDVTQQKAGEETMRSIVQTAGAAIVFADRAGRIVGWNEGAQRVFGHTEAEILGKPLPSLLENGRHEGGRADSIARMFAGGTPRAGAAAIELVARRKDGTQFPIEFSIDQCRDGESPLFTCTIRDISARKQTQKELTLLQHVTHAISDADDFSAALETTLREVCEGTGWSFGEAWVARTDGASLEYAPAWHGRGAGLLQFRKASRKLTVRRGEGLAGRVWDSKRAEWVSDILAGSAGLRRLGAAREAGLRSALGVPVMAHGEVNAVLVFFSPDVRVENKRVEALVTTIAAALGSVLDRKQVEEALARYEQRIETMREVDQAIIASRSPQAVAQAALRRIPSLVPCVYAAVVAFKSKPDGQAATVLAAYSRPEPKVGPGVRLSLEELGEVETLRAGKIQLVKDIDLLPRIPPYFRIVRSEGVRSYLNVPLLFKGELIGVLSLGADRPNAFDEDRIQIALEMADSLAIAIEQAHLYERAARGAAELRMRIAERTAELEEINAELESFCFSVSHDLRAPLRAIQGFAHALLQDCAKGLDVTGRDYARRVVRAAGRMDNLIQDLLEYSRLTRAKLKLVPIRLAPLVAEVLFQLESEIHERGAEVSVQAPLPEVISHHGTLLQVVMNLISNAIKFVDEGVKPKVRVWVQELRTSVRLYVEDNGIGIPHEQHDRIFKIFERLHGIETYPGTGVGLAIVRKGTERLGGQVGLKSSPGHGSLFWIDLPKKETAK